MKPEETGDRLTRLRALLEASTPGRWEAQPSAVVTRSGLVVANPPCLAQRRAVAALGTLWPQLLAVVVDSARIEQCEDHAAACCDDWCTACERQAVSETALSASLDSLRDAIREYLGDNSE